MSLPGFVELLRCPETHGKLSVAPPAVLLRMREAQTAGKLFYKNGQPVTSPVEEGLLREDGAILYPIRNGIPVLIKEEAIPVDQA